MPSKPEKQWADGPYQLLETPFHRRGGPDPSLFVANEMAMAHNMYIRGMNAIVLQAEGVTKDTEITDFLTFCQCWIETIHHHHHLEETEIFPSFERITKQPGIMDDEVAGHETFEAGLETFEAYIAEKLKVGGEGYEGKKLRGLLEAFAGDLLAHLNAEVGKLESLAQWDKDGGRLTASWKAIEEEFIKDLDKSRVHPIALGCTDSTFEGGCKWPPLPFFVPYLVDWVFARKHRGAWRFLPSDFHGNPRPLQFLAKQ